VYFEKPKSFTGEDMVEFHVHGGRAVIQSCLSAIHLVDPVNVRVAERGEFSRRAFENGKMDLTEIEGLNDLINAETEFQRLQAFGQMSGRLGKLYESWRSDIMFSLANLEALIDFGEDAEIPASAWNGIQERVESISRLIESHLNDHQRGQRIRDGIRIVINGPPNVGKSSLLNILADRDAAIVSPIAGTTRDVLEVSLDISGFAVIVSDTAGIRESADPIEQEGIRRAQNSFRDADIRVAILDSTAHQFSEYKQWIASADILLWNKSDLVDQTPSDSNPTEELAQLRISCKTGEGITELYDCLTSRIHSLLGIQYFNIFCPSWLILTTFFQ
jgi:tRNA modification GTPase